MKYNDIINLFHATKPTYLHMTTELLLTKYIYNHSIKMQS